MARTCVLVRQEQFSTVLEMYVYFSKGEILFSLVFCLTSHILFMPSEAGADCTLSRINFSE